MQYSIFLIHHVYTILILGRGLGVSVDDSYLVGIVFLKLKFIYNPVNGD